MTPMRTLLLLLLWVVSAASAASAEILPNPTVQAQIDATAIRLRSGITQDEGLASIRQLEQAYTNKSFLVQQVMLYLRFKANTEERGYGAIVILNKLDVDKTTKIKAAMPQLDATDAQLQKIAADVLRSADKDKAHADGVDFSLYDGILRETPTTPPTALVRYMYERNPQAAVVAIARVYGQGVPESEVAAKAKGDVKVSVDYFAERSEWWAHLYAAAVMEKEPHLRTPDLVKKLEADANPLVREKVFKLNDKLQPK